MVSQRTKRYGGVLLIVVGFLAVFAMEPLDGSDVSVPILGLLAVVSLSLGTLAYGTSAAGRPA